MADQHDDEANGNLLNERILDLLIYIPAGIAVSVAEEIPKLAVRGRERLGVRVSSARAVGMFAVKAGRNEFVRRSRGLVHRAEDRSPGDGPSSHPASPTDRGSEGATPPTGPPSSPRTWPKRANGHVPAVSTLSIPGFDTLSASQVVQRLDGLNRVELVSVRAYEASTRGRRTILNRVDQLLDERS
jgi:hypothetical protein